MKIPHDKFCVLPWISLEAAPLGTVRPCCLAEDEILDNAGDKFNLRTAGFQEIQNSEYMNQLRQAFLEGKQPETCRKCWREEEAGRTSKRQHTLDRLQHVISDESWSTDAKPLMFLDLKLGNICNLKCRICGSWSSSTFATEEIVNMSDPENRKTNPHYLMLKQGAWPRETPKFWHEIDGVLEGIRYIEFTGGEPFMIQEHFDMLEKICQRGLAPGVEIHYNTNGTHYPKQAEEIWRHFRTVEIAFSVDDINERFEYQRTGAVWQEVRENLKRFQDLRARHSNIKLQVCSTVNVFNVMYLEDLANWIDQQGFNFIYWNMLHQPDYFSITSLTKQAKVQARERLESAQVTSRHRAEFDRIRDFMMAGESLNPGAMLNRIRELDLRRDQNLRTHHRILADAIEYAGP